MGNDLRSRSACLFVQSETEMLNMCCDIPMHCSSIEHTTHPTNNYHWWTVKSALTRLYGVLHYILMSLDLFRFSSQHSTKTCLLTSVILTVYPSYSKWTNSTFLCAWMSLHVLIFSSVFLSIILLFLLLIIISFHWQPSLFRPAILSELWAREHFITIPAPFWPGRPDLHHYYHHKCNQFITGTPAAAARARHLSIPLSPPQPALQPEYKTWAPHSKRQRWRLVTGQGGTKELFQFEPGGEASESGAAQSGSLGDEGAQ